MEPCSRRGVRRNAFLENRGRRIDEDAVVRRLPAVTLSVVAVWTVGALWIDQHLDRTGQLVLGVFTACVLAALLALQPAAVRLQTLAVVGIATLGEVIGSIVWGVYTLQAREPPDVRAAGPRAHVPRRDVARDDRGATACGSCCGSRSPARRSGRCWG